MSTTNLSPVQFAAALAEIVYHRADQDDPITYESLGAEAIPLDTPPTGLVTDSAGTTFYSPRGFVGQVVEKGDTLYVVFRGTDLSASFIDGFKAGLFNGLDQTAQPDDKRQIDPGDIANDLLLGIGTANQTQFDDALALTRAVEQLAAARKQKVVIVGQSLGGGLAGLVSAIEGIPGYAFDPAPFANQLNVVAQEQALVQAGIDLGPISAASFIANPLGLPISDGSVGQAALALVTQIVTLLSPSASLAVTTAQVSYLLSMGNSPFSIFDYFQDWSNNLSHFQGNMLGNLKISAVTGEFLSSGALGGVFSGAGAKFSISRQSIDVGVSPAFLTDDTAVSLHSPALINLLLRTEGTAKQFEDLLKGDEELRYSLLEKPGISGPVEGNRTDPTSGGFGYSGVASGGSAPGILYRELWKTVGDTDGFYEKFYARFGTWLSVGAVGQGLSATAQTDQLSVHSGVVKLGLQVVRDALGTQSDGSFVNDVGMNVFGAGDANGPSAGYIRVDLGDIDANPDDPTQEETLSGSLTQAYGVRDINTAVAEAVATDLVDAGIGFTNAALTAIVGATRNEVRDGSKALSTDWRILIAQAGSADGAIAYDAKHAGDSGDASVSHVVLGGTGADDIKGSSASDYLVGGDGNNKFEGGGGSDVIVGGKDKDTYTAHSGGAADSVVFLGGAGNEDTAIYGSDFSGQTLTVTYSKLQSVDPYAGITVQAGGGQADTLIGVETVKVTEANTTVQIKDDLSTLKTKVKFEADSVLGSGKATVDFSSLSQGISLTSIGDLVRYGNALFDEFSKFKLTSQDDTVKETDNGLTIDLGGGNDTVRTTGAGTIIHTGSGSDKIEISHNGQLLIEDASADDRITSNGVVLTGGVQFGTESKYAYGNGVRYGRNQQGDLVIIDALGNETFIPHFNFTTDASSNLTAGLFVIQVTYRIERSNGWTAGFETAASALNAMKKIGQALTGKMRTWTDPLVLDLNGDGVNLSSMAGNDASFDVDKDGFAERVGWVRGGDGMLVRDLNGNGKIDDIGEMFGNDQTPGFTQLASLDGNHDGKISALDDGLADFNGDGVVDTTDTFATLKVWVDANEDGRTDAGELKSLASLNIVSISTGSTVTNTTDSGNIIAATGTFERADGTTGTIGEVQFDTDNTHTIWQGDSSVSSDAATRPDLKGFGTLTDLHVAMTLHSDLVQTVDAALPSLNTLSLSNLRDAARTVLYAWADAVTVPVGTPGTEATQDFWFVGDVTRTGGVAYDFIVQKGTRDFDTGNGIEKRPYYGYASGQFVYWPNTNYVNDYPTIEQVLASTPQQGSWYKLSAQDIAFLERYTGVELGFGISNNPSADAIQVVANGLTASWNTLNRLAVRLAAQGPLAPFFAGIAYDVATDTFHPTTDHQLVPMLEAIFHATPATASAAQDYLAQWQDVINVVLPDFQRDNDGHQLTDAFLFQNLVGAYEDVPLPISLQQAAAIFAIPASEIKTGTGTVVGDDTKTDLFYLDSTNQLLQGQGGSDAYVVGYNFGHDVIQDVWQGLGQNQEDSIWFSHLNVSDLTFTRDGLDLLITQNGTSNQIRVVDEFAGRRPGLVTAFQDFDKQIEIIKFADGTTWDQLDIAKAIGMPSYATDDNLIGTPDVDFLNGGAGTDFMSGGDAGDHYFFDRGDGHDTVEDREVWIWQASNDYVHFGAGITEDDVTFQRVGVSNDLQISINGTNDVLTVNGQFAVAYGLLNTQQNRIEIFTFDDGSYVGWEDIIKSLDAAAGTAGDDTITGFDYDDLLDGGAGNDFMTGGNGNDTYVFGRGYGHDTIEDRVNYILSGTDDTVQFKEGISLSDLTFHHDGNTSDIRITINGTDDSLTIVGEFSIVYGLIATMDDRIENFTFADGTVLGWHDILLQIDAAAGTDGNDTIYGFGYDDTLRGGKGDDYLVGGQGDDTYVYSRGDGHDTIYDLADAQGPEFDTLVLHGINPADVSFNRVNYSDVALVFAESAPGAGDGGSVVLQAELDNWFAQGVEQVVFDDGTVWTQSDLRVKVLAQASTPGNDTIVAFNTNDIIEGGHGDDTISGGAGDDTYIYTRGDGNDSITEVGLGNYSSFDTLRLHAIDPGAVSLARNGDDLTLVIAESAPGAGDGGSILLKDDLKGWTAAGVEQIVFDDGTVWEQDYLRARVLAELPTDGNDTIYGFNTNDTLRGGKGDDTLYGGTGDDTYVYSRGDGHDTIYEVWLGNYSSFDTLRLQNIAPSAVYLARNGVDLTLVIAESSPGAGDGGSILLTDEETGNQTSGVEQIVFDDGTIWTQADLRAMWLVQATASTDPSISGFNTDDTIVAGTVDRTLHGAGGRDTYVYSSSGGNVVIDDPGHLQSELDFTDIASTDVSLLRPVANSGANLVMTVNSTGKTVTVLNEFTTNGGLRAISFSDGVIWNPDQVKAVLAGGSGDLYVFNRGDGAVTVDQSVASVRLGSDITADDILLQANGRDLIVKLRGTTDTLTVYGALTANAWGVSSTLSSLKFSDGTSLALGQPSAGRGLPLTFTWILNAANFDMVGSAYGTNVYEVTAPGKLNFANVSAIGGTNIVRFDKGAQNLIVDSHNFSGSIVLGPQVSAQEVYWQTDNWGNLFLKLRGDDADSIAIWGDLQLANGVVTSAIKTVTFNDGSVLDTSHGPAAFTWLGNTANFSITGSNLGTNVYEVTVAGHINFGNAAAAGGTNVVKFDKGDQNLTVSANDFGGVLDLGAQIAPQDLYWQTNQWGDLIMKIRGDDADSINVWGDMHVVNGAVTSAIKTVKFADGSALDMSHGPGSFTWLGNTTNFNITGTTFGTNVYEVSAAGTINFANASGVGGTNIVKYDRGDQNLNIWVNNDAGSLELGPGITAQDIYWQANGWGDLNLKIRGDSTDGINAFGDLKIVNGSVVSSIGSVKFSNGTILDISHGPSSFTWLGNTANFNVTGTTFGTNIYEVTTAGTINFANASGVGGTNIVKYDRGDQNLIIWVNNDAGSLELGPGITASDIYWQANSWGDLNLKIRGDSADSISAYGDLRIVNGVVTSSIGSVKFGDGTVLDISHGPAAFTWLGNTANFDITGTTFGTNVYEVTAANGKINFADASVAGGINIVRFDKGDQALNVQANNFAGSLELGPQISASDVYWQTNNYGDLILKIRGDDADSINVWGDLHVTNGVVTSAIKTVKFSDGTVLDMSQGPSAFTWIGTANNYNLVGSNMRSNVFEITHGNGAITFGNASGGGNGLNTIRYDLGDGLADVQLNGGKGVVAFGSNVSAQDVILASNSNGDLIVKFRNDTTDAITIHNDIVFGNVNSYGISGIQFADGTTWDYTFIASNAWVRGTAGNDQITLPVNAGTVDTGAGDDTFSVSGNGSDRIVFGAGSGHDLLDNPGNGYQRTDVLDLAGLLPSDVVVSRSGNQLIVKVSATGETFTALWQFYGDSLSYGVGSIKFADGTVWDRTTIATNAWVRGTSGNDSITLPATGITADAGTGDDTISVSGNGSDRIIFAQGYGHDTLTNPGSGYNRDDTLVLVGLNPANVQLSRNGDLMILKVLSTGDTFNVNFQFWGDGSQIQGLTHIQFADGTLWDRTTIAANAWIRGTSGNDSLTLPATGFTADAGAGDDTISVSGTGSDRIIFAKGYGHDTLTNPGSGYNRDDTLVLNGINPWEVQFSRSGDAMTLSVPSTGDSFRVNFQYWGDGSQIQGLTRIQFANGSTWNRSNLADATSTFTWTGSAANATLTGNDYGSNVFQLGGGAETAYGGARSNVYQVATTTGQAQINLSSATGSMNEIDFLSGMTDQNLWFEQAGNDLKIDLLGSGTSTTISNWFSGSAGALQEITAGGLKIDSQITQLVQAMALYTASNAGFDPASSSIQALPNDTALQGAVTAAWHA